MVEINNKLTVLSTNFFIYPDEIGGSYNLADNINKRISKKGYKVITVSINPDNKLLKKEIEKNITHYRVNITKNKSRFARFISEIFSLRKKYKKILKKEKINLIHIHDFITGLAIILTPKNKSFKKIYHFHGSFLQEEKSNFWKEINKLNIIKKIFGKIYFFLLKKLYSKFLKSIDKFIVLSEYSKSVLKSEIKVKDQNIYKIPSGVDVGRFKIYPAKKEARNILNIQENKIIILTIRRLVNRMGLEELIESIKLFDSDLKQKILLLIGGKGELKNKLLKLVKKLGLSNNVKLLGFIPDDKLALYYRAADLFIMPSKELEGFGLVILESMASGIPVIGTKIGGINEIIGGFNKDLLVDKCTPLYLSKAIGSYFNNKILISKEDCRRYVLENYQWDNLISDIENIYLSMAK